MFSLAGFQPAGCNVKATVSEARKRAWLGLRASGLCERSLEIEDWVE